MYFFNLIGLR